MQRRTLGLDEASPVRVWRKKKGDAGKLEVVQWVREIGARAYVGKRCKIGCEFGHGGFTHEKGVKGRKTESQLTNQPRDPHLG